MSRLAGIYVLMFAYLIFVVCYVAGIWLISRIKKVVVEHENMVNSLEKEK